MAAEQLRRILLKEMGITSWFPRAPLPGAALSHEQCLRIFLDESPVSAAPVATANLQSGTSLRESTGSGPVVHRTAETQQPPATRSSVAQLAELLGKKPAGPVPSGEARLSAADPLVVTPQVAPLREAPVQDIQQSAEEGAAAQNEEVDAFGFSWFNVDRRLAVLAMLPEGNTRLTSSCRQMLARMLAALHTPWQSIELGDQNFHWPFADDLGLPADAAAARQAVDGFIARRLREQNCAMLLVLCDGLPWFFQPAADAQHTATGVEDPTQLRVHRQFGFAMLATHSLHAMEKDAGLKREAWQSMQLLRERLNRNN